MYRETAIAFIGRIPNFVQTVYGLTDKHALLEHDGKPVESGFPVFQRLGSFLADVHQRQIEQFQYCFITGKDPRFLITLRSDMFTGSMALVV